MKEGQAIDRLPPVVFGVGQIEQERETELRAMEAAERKKRERGQCEPACTVM
jgi:hypothetical protein